MSELSLHQIQERAIKKLLTIHGDSDDGAIVIFKDGDSVSISIINLSVMEMESMITSLNNRMEDKDNE